MSSREEKEVDSSDEFQDTASSKWKHRITPFVTITELFQSSESLLDDEVKIDLDDEQIRKESFENELDLVITEPEADNLALLEEMTSFYDVLTDITLIQSPSVHRFLHHKDDVMDQHAFFHPITNSWREMQHTISAINYSVHLPSQMDVQLPSLEELELQISADIHLEMRQEKLVQILPNLIGYDLM